MVLKQELKDYIHTDMLNINNYSGVTYIIEGCEVTGNTPNDMNVIINSGKYMLNEIEVELAGDIVLLEASNPNMYKYGIIRGDVDGNIDVIYGIEEMTNGIKPNRPLNVPDYDPDNYIALARILIGDVTEILQNNIYDLRIFGKENILEYDIGDVIVSDTEIEDEKWELIYEEEISEELALYYYRKVSE